MKRLLCLIIICLFSLRGISQNITDCRYWLNNDFSNANDIEVSGETVNLNLNYSNIPIGYYQINFQFKQSNGLWSSPSSQWFFKGSSGSGAMGYRYWFNNDFNHAVTVNSSLDSLNLSIISDSLKNGYYLANFQFKDNSGNWSSVVSNLFYKTRSNKQLIKACRYWFDNDVANTKTIIMQSSTYNPVIINMDVESLSLGPHTINIQFQDDGGTWSSVETDLINRNTITSKLFIEPKVYVQKSLVTSGDVQTVTGNDFTSSGQINLFVQNSTGDITPINNSFTYLPNGSFSYQLPIVSSMPGGEYKVYATDVNTGETSPIIKFEVNAPVTQKLWITEPSSSASYATNSPITINWSDFVTATNAIGKTGLVQKKYKIEYSNDNGNTWEIIESLQVQSVQSNQTDPFNTSYQFLTAGNYIIRITDLDNLSDFNTTSFSVSSTVDNGFSASLAWDHSIPAKTYNPIGLAADGTARIFIKLKRDTNNKKPVAEIDASISPANSNDNSSSTELLGKIMYANDTSSYSSEANAANQISDSKTFSSPSLSNSFAFWLVAPDDFTQDLNNQDAERTVKVTVNISYSDNTTVQEEEIVRIVRPPLMLVHGLNGDATSLENSKYNLDIDGVPKYFSNDNFRNLLWINSYRRITLDKAASYSYNAKTILDINQNESDLNTFQSQLTQMRVSKYACSRVDYVCHSMGGCIARYAINFFPSYYYTNLNYGKGFINKLITLNTPHNGSYLADWVSDEYGDGLTLLNHPLTYDILGYGTYFHKLDGFFVPVTNSSYEVSDAVKNLRAYQGGIRFPSTTVKNHLIGSEEDPHDYNIDNEVYLFSNEGIWGGVFYSLYHTLLGAHIFTSVHKYILQHYDNDEYLSNSDMVVPISSQLNYQEAAASPINNNALAKTTTSVLYSDGLNHVNHIDITDDIDVGNRIMALLNASINSNDGYFADNISQSPSYTARLASKTQSFKEAQTSTVGDSDINYIDSGHIEITGPTHNSTVYVDSTIDINLSVKDTNNLQKIQLVFQGEYYESYSKIANQTFNVKVHSDAIGYNQIVAQGLYDSSGFTIYHADTVTLIVRSLDQLKGFYITQKTQNLNRNQTFEPVYNAVYNNYVGVLNDNVDSLNFTIADTNVVKYIDSLREFTTKDTGTTYIVYDYKGFIDTGFIYVSLPQENPNITFSGKVFLQGAYNTTTNLMNNSLNSLGILQTNASSQPYNNTVFNYSGTENVPSGFFAAHPDIVDWVLLELRDSASPSTIIATRAAFVEEDGTLVETDGTNPEITFNDVPFGNYYVAIHHRNHLGIRSSVTIDFIGGSGSYDFTTAPNKAYQNQTYTSTVQDGSIWAMRAGNANSNNNVKYNGPANDQNQILNLKLMGSLSNILNNVYAPDDINMNGNVKWNGPGNDQNFLLNTILNGSLSTIYLEQL